MSREEFAEAQATTNLLHEFGWRLKQVVVDLGYRGVDADNLGVAIIHRGRYKFVQAAKALRKGANP